MTYPLLPNAVDLTFEFPALSPAPSAVDLTFGATLGPPPGTVYEATMVAKFALRGSVTVDYDSAQWRGLRSDTVVPHQQAAPRCGRTAAAWRPSMRAHVASVIPHAQAKPLPTSDSAVWMVPSAARLHTDVLWGRAGHTINITESSGWAYSAKQSLSKPLPWSTGAQRCTGAAARFGLAKSTPRHLAMAWDEGLGLQHAVTTRMNQMAKAMKPFVVVPWQTALVLASYGGPQYLPPSRPIDPGVLPTVIDIRFCAAYPGGGNPSYGLTLIFGLNPCGGITPDSPVYILPARYYMAVHSVEAHLLPGLTPIPIFDVSLGADVDSTVWTFSAKGPMSLFDALAPATAGTPTQVRITLDGLPFVFLVDKLRSDERFGQRQAVISGRSATALVGQPYARQTSRLSTVAKTAQQHALDALHLTGVGLDWGITDWLVPAGAWSHTGTPLSAVQAIAQAAGGYINSHRSDPTVLVRHPYPTLPGGIPGGPWNWEGAAGAFAADVELAPDALITSSIERVDGPDVDGIYVSGTTQGIQAHVYRQGTLGAKLAPMEVDALITANAAAQQRGYSVLGQAGAKHLVQISMPVLVGGSNPGVLDVGQLVQINHAQPWRGRIRSVSVQAAMPKVRQTITLERHLS